MPTFDFKALAQDLDPLENRLKRYGAQQVKDETSLNTLFCNHLASGGSRTRALLALGAGQALALPDEVRFPIATSVELLHQASLIHDDVQDEDILRRGKAAVWQVAGVSSAICLGDELIAAAFEELAYIPAPYISDIPRLTVMLSRGVSVMAAGQTLDCQWKPCFETNLEDYEDIVRHKSGPLLGLPIAMLLALTGGSDDQVTRLLGGASSIGVAYQLADDLSDREEDKNQRLNGFWVLRRTVSTDDDAEELLRQRFEWHLWNARQCVQSLPAFCIEAFDVLIQALQHKYPSFEVAA